MAGRLDSETLRGSDRLTAGLVPQLAPRLALLVLSVVFTGFFVNAFLYVIAGGASPARIVPAVVCLCALMLLQLRFFSNPQADVRGRRGYAALLFQAILVYVPLAYYGQAWMGMSGFLAGNALLVLRPAVAWSAFATIAAINGLVQWNLTGSLVNVAYIANITAVTGLVVYGLSRLRSMVKELDDARSELAGLAVTQERLRFARDLHDLLGFSLSAITLKSELSHRLAAGQPERAQLELSEILDISRQALTDVRAVASSYRELSLDDEMASARSVLGAADVEVATRTADGELPPRIRTVLATVLREGVTNLLRHSKAETCEIAVTRDKGAVSIEIVNDGVRAGTDPDHGNGIGNLTTRVEALGGHLTAGTTVDDTYRLRAEIPLTPGPDPAPWAQKTRRRVHGPTIAPLLAFVIVAAVFVGYAVSAMILALVSRLSLAETLAASAFVITSLLLELGYFSRPDARLRSRLGYSALLAQAGLTFLPIVLFSSPMLGLPGFLAGSALLVLPPRFGLVAFVGVVASIGTTYAVLGAGMVDIGYGVVATMNIGLVVYGFSRLRSMVKQLHDARSELAELAVTDERLRFARDLHDLLGFSLSAITLKSELAHRLVTRDTERAQRELSEILDTSRQALADVRAVASSYRELSLDEETVSARALLSAADIKVTMRLDECELPQEVRTTLATVLREGVTNLLRHSKAENCQITLAYIDDRLTMEIVNDGVATKPAAGESGSGIHNLTTRLEGVGGTLRAGTTSDNTYRLHAEIPLTRA